MPKSVPFSVASVEEQIRGVFKAAFSAPNERLEWRDAEGRAVLSPGVVTDSTVLQRILDPAVLPLQSAPFQRAFVATLRGALDGKPENVVRVLHLSDRKLSRDELLKRCVSCVISDALGEDVAADMAALVGTLCSVTATPAVLRHLFSLMRGASAQRIHVLLAVVEATLMRHPSYHALPRAFFSLGGGGASALGMRPAAGAGVGEQPSSSSPAASPPTWPFTREYMLWAWIRMSPVTKRELARPRVGWGGADGRAYLMRLITATGHGVEIYVNNNAQLCVEIRDEKGAVAVTTTNLQQARSNGMWQPIAVRHIKSRFGDSGKLFVFVFGKEVAATVLRFPRIAETEPIAFCEFGRGWNGEIGPIFLFRQSISSEALAALSSSSIVSSTVSVSKLLRLCYY